MRIKRSIIKCFISLSLIGLVAMNYGNAAWIEAKARLAQQLIEHSWEATIENGGEHKPWGWADTWPVARLKHPASNTDLYVLEGADGSSLAFGPGHMHGTSAPGFGASVIGGHRDTHFEFLREAQLKDELLLQRTDGQWRNYQIESIDIVNADKEPLLFGYENQLILITCFPFESWVPTQEQRYVVRARQQTPDA